MSMTWREMGLADIAGYIIAFHPSTGNAGVQHASDDVAGNGQYLSGPTSAPPPPTPPPPLPS